MRVWDVPTGTPITQPLKKDGNILSETFSADGRWVIEDLTARIPGKQSGAIWVGFRRAAGDPRLWSSGIDSENAFVRDSDPARFLRPMPIRKTPMIRLDWAP